ncbi:aminoglycoside phosphotransferase (APT) family kinase protein [Arthrobacter sp. CAN_A212]|uniref:phosphotransferase family protein n=1 Tax=Arthrobacter sp. CAN_A212 TaxID=2787719 RepID=UPI0018CB7FC2
MNGILEEIALEVFPSGDWREAHHVDFGQFHDVLVLQDVAVVRIARSLDQGLKMTRRMELLRRINRQVPFKIPVPLTEVQWHGDRAAVAQQYVPGVAHPSGSGDPEQLRALVQSLDSMETAPLGDLVGEPFSYAGPWDSGKQQRLFANVPRAVHGELHRRLDPLLSMDVVEPSLVHGDLAGHNIHWVKGRLNGVLDWDLASLWDPAINVAYLSMWHGDDIAGKITDSVTAGRARVWRESLILESISRAISDGRADRVEMLTEKLRSSM